MKTFEKWWKEHVSKADNIDEDLPRIAWNAAIHAAQEHLIQQQRLVAASSLRVLKSGGGVGNDTVTGSTRPATGVTKNSQ
jgi:hypothetical protein